VYSDGHIKEEEREPEVYENALDLAYATTIEDTIKIGL
jgi:hypothetical protein